MWYLYMCSTFFHLRVWSQDSSICLLMSLIYPYLWLNSTLLYIKTPYLLYPFISCFQDLAKLYYSEHDYTYIAVIWCSFGKIPRRRRAGWRKQLTDQLLIAVRNEKVYFKQYHFCEILSAEPGKVLNDV